MSGFTKWCVLCWGIRIRGGKPYLLASDVEKAGGKMVTNNMQLLKSGMISEPEPHIVICLPGTVWRTTGIREVMQENLEMRRRYRDIRKVVEQLGIESEDMIGSPGWFLLLNTTVE